MEKTIRRLEEVGVTVEHLDLGFNTLDLPTYLNGLCSPRLMCLRLATMQMKHHNKHARLQFP